MNKHVLFLLLASLSFSGGAQTIDIRDIQYNQGFHFGNLTHQTYRFIYKIKSRDPQRSLFRKIDFNSRLTLLDTTLIEFVGNFSLLESAITSQYTATIFGSAQTASLIIHFIDNATEAQSSFPLTLTESWNGRNVKILASANQTSFFVLYQSNAKTWGMQEVDVNGQQVWRKTIKDVKDKFYIERMTLLNSDHLALLLSKNHSSRKIKNEIKVIDVHTGEDVYITPLHSDQYKSTIDNSFVVDSAFYLSGRTFFTRRVSNQTTGLPYLKAFNNQTPDEIKLTSSLMSLKTFWMDLIQTEEGHRYLIGETFTNEQFGPYLLKGVITGIFTMGMLSVTWTSMKFHDVAVVSIDNPDAPPLSLIKLKPRRIQLGSYTPGYQFAKYSYTTGQVRYWGHDGMGNIFLLDGTLLKKYNLASQYTEELGRLPENSSRLVVHADDNYLVYLNRRKLDNLVAFKVLPLKKTE